MKARALLGPKSGPVRTHLRRAQAALRSRLGRRRRNARRDTTLIAITGSAGKTTAAQLLAAILAECGETYSSTLGNTLKTINQRIWQVKRSHRFAVFEVGMDEPGGIADCANVLDADMAILTFIGTDHWKRYRSKEAIAAEKGALFASLRPEATAILNAGDPMTPRIAASTAARIVRIGLGEAADIRAENIEMAFPDGLRMDVVDGAERLRLTTNLIGRHWAITVLAAVAAARRLGADNGAISRAVAAFQPVRGRCSVHAVEGGPVFLLDTVKAPFETMNDAIAILADAPAPRKTVIVGNISDYGGTVRTKYQSVYDFARTQADRVIFVGDQSGRVRPDHADVQGGRYFAFSGVGALSAFLKDTAQAGEVILVKGAGADHLERVALDQTRPVACWDARCGLARTCFGCDRLRAAAQ